MVFKETTGKKTIVCYETEGDEAEYISQLRAMVIALSSTDNSSVRKTLSDILLDMLPTENNITLSPKCKH